MESGCRQLNTSTGLGRRGHQVAPLNRGAAAALQAVRGGMRAGLARCSSCTQKGHLASLQPVRVDHGRVACPWLPDTASLLRVHRAALGTVEGLREGRQVLQRAQHPAGNRDPESACWAWGGVGACPRGGRGHLPVLQGAMDVGLDGLYGKLRPVGPTPHLWAQEGHGCRTGGGASLGNGTEE